MARLLSLLLTLGLVVSLAIPGGGVGRCEADGAASAGCCPAATPAVVQGCCCLDQPAPAPATLPTVDRHWLVDGSAAPLPVRGATLWSYAPAAVPQGAWRPAPPRPFGGAPPPRERSCIILT